MWAKLTHKNLLLQACGIFASLPLPVLGDSLMSCPNVGANIFHIWRQIWVIVFLGQGDGCAKLHHMDLKKKYCTCCSLHEKGESSQNDLMHPLHLWRWWTSSKFAQKHPMSLRHCEWRVCGHGHTASKPSIHRAPSYSLQNYSGSLKKKIWMDEILAEEKSMFTRWRGWLFISSYESICVWFWRFPKDSPKFPMEFSRGNYIPFTSRISQIQMWNIREASMNTIDHNARSLMVTASQIIPGGAVY